MDNSVYSYKPNKDKINKVLHITCTLSSSLSYADDHETFLEGEAGVKVQNWSSLENKQWITETVPGRIHFLSQF